MDSDSDYEKEAEYISESESETSVSYISDNEESEDDSPLLPAQQWCKINPVIELNQSDTRFPFQGDPGIKVTFDPDGDILQYFEAYFDDELIEMITTETNRYALQCEKFGAQCSFSRSTQWNQTTKNEMRIFLAIIMLQSIVKKPELSLFWTKKSSIETPFFAKIMSYRRFVLLKKYLHFTNNEEYDPQNHPIPKLNKIWPVFLKLNEQFRSVYVPHRDICIDESLMLYKGRLSWIQYMPLKRARFGIKTFMLCESKSGYIWNSLIYIGKGTVDDEYADLPISTQVVLNLIKPLLYKGYCLTTDNFYTSPQLADRLIQSQTDIYGTVKLTRKDMPPELKKEKLEKGDAIAYQKGKVLVMRWKDKRDVNLLSTIHNPCLLETEKRGKTKKIPQVVIDYNQTMGGVDRVDQHLSDYPIPRHRGKKYYKKIFYHLLEQALWNSFVIYVKEGGTKTHLQYRMEVIDKIIEKYHSPEFSSQGGRPGTQPNPLRLTGRHFPEIIPPTEKKTNPTRQCAVCCSHKDEHNKKIRRESRYYCPECNVGLCAAPCFKIYHTKVNF